MSTTSALCPSLFILPNNGSTIYLQFHMILNINIFQSNDNLYEQRSTQLTFLNRKINQRLSFFEITQTLTIWIPSSSSSGLLHSLKQSFSACFQSTPRSAKCCSASVIQSCREKRSVRIFSRVFRVARRGLTCDFGATPDGSREFLPLFLIRRKIDRKNAPAVICEIWLLPNKVKYWRKWQF